MGKTLRSQQKTMIKVAHIIRSYLIQSETFIWQYLHSFKNFIPIVLTRNLENGAQFPLPNGRIKLIYGSRTSIPWLMDNLYRRILKQPFGYVEKVLRNENIRLIHAHFGPMGCNYLPLSLTSGIPLVTNFYGRDLYVKDFLNEHQESYLQLFEKGDHFLVEGPFMRKTLVSLGCSEYKISIQRIAIDLKNYKFEERLWNKRRPFRFLFVGRFVEKKGLEFALSSLAQVREKYSFEFRIIGDGPLEKKLRSLGSRLGLTKEIMWLGVKPHERVIKELQNCDILIQPSVTAKNGDSEGGAPTIILEAQACGVPVLSTNHADIPYVTCLDGSALLSTERDVDGLAKNIRVLLDNTNRWPIMGRKGRHHVEKFHDVNSEVLGLENIYKNLLSIETG
jgi:colanic acid/amylovoran biosynthesis glycosyltransferase